MPPARRGVTRRWDAALHVGGELVTTPTGAVLPQSSYVELLGWVTPASEGGMLTNRGMQAVKDGWWVDPPDQVLRQVRERQQFNFRTIDPSNSVDRLDSSRFGIYE